MLKNRRDTERYCLAYTKLFEEPYDGDYELIAEGTPEHFGWALAVVPKSIAITAVEPYCYEDCPIEELKGMDDDDLYYIDYADGESYVGGEPLLHEWRYVADATDC